MKGTIITLVIVGAFIAFAVNTAWTHWQVGMQYDREVGGFFDYSDRGSDAKAKLEQFNLYMEALERNGLTTGFSAMFFQEQPEASLDKNYEVAKSLQKRLSDLASTDPATNVGYGSQMEQITKHEYCWFPDEVFEQAYMWKHGAWGLALFPVKPSNSCVSSNSNGGVNINVP